MVVEGADRVYVGSRTQSRADAAIESMRKDTGLHDAPLIPLVMDIRDFNVSRGQELDKNMVTISADLHRRAGWLTYLRVGALQHPDQLRWHFSVPTYCENGQGKCGRDNASESAPSNWGIKNISEFI